MWERRPFSFSLPHLTVRGAALRLAGLNALQDNPGFFVAGVCGHGKPAYGLLAAGFRREAGQWHILRLRQGVDEKDIAEIAHRLGHAAFRGAGNEQKGILSLGRLDFALLAPSST